jgi:hypothetical protein
MDREHGVSLGFSLEDDVGASGGAVVVPAGERKVETTRIPNIIRVLLTDTIYPGNISSGDRGDCHEAGI